MASPYSRWQDAMFAQERLLGFYQTTKGQRYLQGFYEDMNYMTTPQGRRDVEILANIHVRTVFEGEPVWVAAEACQLVDKARETFEPEPVLATDPFVPCGFALLAEPLLLHDAPWREDREGRAKTGVVPVRAIAWIPIHNDDATAGCFWIHTFVHIQDELDLGVGSEWTDEAAAAMAEQLPLALGHTFQWTWGEAAWLEPDRLDVREGDDREQAAMRAREQSALVQTLWRIGSQFVPAKARAARQTRRQRQRKRLKHTDDVTVIRLRRSREYGDEPEPTGRQLTVQHLVRGYWAIRHTREGPRQVWVRPHVKGPEGGEFKETTRAWEFTR